MKVSVDKSILEQSLAQANRIIERRLASPVLGNILLETLENDQLKLTATNSDMTLVNILPCTVMSPGKYCLPAGLLFDIVKKLETDVVFEYTQNVIKVLSNKASFSIHYASSTEFPPITELKYDYEFELGVKELKEAIDITKVAMSQDISIIQLYGIYMHFVNDVGLKLVATDLFRIACVTLPSSERISETIISRRCVGELLHLLDNINNAERIKLKISNGQIAFEATLKNSVKSSFSSRLVAGKFPEYRSALQIQNDKQMIVDTQSILNALNRVSTVVTDTSNSIKLHIENNKLTISALSKECGSAVDELEVEFNSNETLEICFNSKYLIELIRQIKTQRTELLFNTSTSPTLIKPEDNNSAIFVIMPVEIINT